MGMSSQLADQIISASARVSLFLIVVAFWNTRTATAPKGKVGLFCASGPAGRDDDVWWVSTSSRLCSSIRHSGRGGSDLFTDFALYAGKDLIIMQGEVPRAANSGAHPQNGGLDVHHRRLHRSR
jgi:hypothetical protein